MTLIFLLNKVVFDMNVKKITFLGLMLALILVLSMLENMLPPFFPMLPPQFSRIGLSNVIVMYLVFFMGKKEAVTMAVLKALFGLLMRGLMAGLLSLAGGLLSIFFIILLLWIFRGKVSYIALSIAGAIAHNLGQLTVASLILENWNLFVFYFPILLISGVIFGSITGTFLKIIMPVFDRMHKGGNL